MCVYVCVREREIERERESKSLKKLSRVKHSSLFDQSVNDEEEKFDKIDTGSLVEATIGAAANQRKKRQAAIEDWHNFNMRVPPKLVSGNNISQNSKRLFSDVLQCYLIMKMH